MWSIKQAIRQLTLRASLPLVVVAMLAVGIGGTTAIFALYYFVELKTLPVADPSTLVNLRAPGERPGHSRPSVTIDDQESAFSYAMFRDLESVDGAFSGLAAHYDFPAQITIGAQRNSGRGLLVSGHYFDVLGLRPAAGRLIGPQDEPRVGDGDVVVLSYDYWQSRFAGDPDVLGELITVNNRMLTVVGVAPAEFSGTITGWRPQVYVPITLRWAMQPEMPRDYDDREARWLHLFARLRRGVDAAQAADVVNRRYAAVLAEIEAPSLAGLTDGERERLLSGRIVLAPGGRGQNPPAEAAAPALLMLAAMVLVLVIVCINVANLLLARGATRSKELAVRAAMGASRRALIAQLLLESTLLALIGGALSVPIAFAGMAAIEGALLPPNLAELVDLEISPAALVFAAAVTIATVLLCGVLPALKLSRADPGSIIKAQSVSAPGARARGRLRGGLLPVQIALAVALLVLAGLFTGSLMNVSRVELGMDVEPVVTFSVAPLIAGYDAGRVDPLYDEIARRMDREPGVRSVASGVIPPLSGLVIPANIAGGVAETGGQTPFTQGVPLTGPQMFDTLSIPFVAGRDFTDSDTQPTPLVAIVNEAFVRAHDLGEEPIGQLVRVAGPLVQSTVEVIGVVRDAHYGSIKGPVLPQLFTPRVPANTTFQSRFFYVRTDDDPDGLLTRIPRIVAEIDPSVPVTNLALFSRWARDTSWGDRLMAALTTSFAMLSTLLTAVGLYGVLSFSVARRTREFGLRIALGARPSRLLVGVLKQVATTALIGLGAGLALGLALGALAAGMIYGFGADGDAMVMFGAVVIIAVVVAVASYFPARRAAKLEPMEALRCD